MNGAVLTRRRSSPHRDHPRRVRESGDDRAHRRELPLCLAMIISRATAETIVLQLNQTTVPGQAMDPPVDWRPIGRTLLGDARNGVRSSVPHTRRHTQQP